MYTNKLLSSNYCRVIPTVSCSSSCRLFQITAPKNTIASSFSERDDDVAWLYEGVGFFSGHLFNQFHTAYRLDGHPPGWCRCEHTTFERTQEEETGSFERASRIILCHHKKPKRRSANYTAAIAAWPWLECSSKVLSAEFTNNTSPAAHARHPPFSPVTQLRKVRRGLSERARGPRGPLLRCVCGLPRRGAHATGRFLSTMKRSPTSIRPST